MRGTVSLYVRGRDREIGSVFELSGYQEDDITASLGWALSRSPSLRRGLVRDLLPGAQHKTVASILLQEPAESGGYTDIEMRGDGLHCIVEAKRGWNLPGNDQLRTYATRLVGRAGQRALLVISECSREYAALALPDAVREVPLLYRSWRQIDLLASDAAVHASLHERRLLAELKDYLGRAMSMQDQESNLVYVVSLAAGTPEWSNISWRDIVTEKRRYFHPFGSGGGWPVDPPNYLGFRYDGRLQSIHHVESYEIVTDLHTRIPELRHPQPGPYVLYSLGDPIRPSHEVTNGRVYPSGRVRAMIDLLLTCRTVAEARDKTKERLARIGRGQGG